MGPFGELRWISSQLLYDSITLSILSYNTITQPTSWKLKILLLTYVVFFKAFGLTKRWTIAFPMIPYLILHILRTQIIPSWSFSLSILSGVLVSFSVVLSCLFPALELKPVKGKYNVGVIDFYLPVDSFSNGISKENKYVSARLLYPTNQITTKSIPYLDPIYGEQICNQFMNIGSPPPLKKFGWILHNWLLAHVSGQRNAIPLESLDGEKLPMAVFSHGLVGTAEIYSFQGMSIAANGTVVLMITHSDGSSPVMKRADGSYVYYNEHFKQLFHEKDQVKEYRTWRGYIEPRSDEFLCATRSFLSFNKTNIDALKKLGISFVNKLNIKDVTFMGHSMGGATALHAAALRPDLVARVVVHDPACEWLPDASRRALFRGSNNGEKTYEGGVGGFEEEEKKYDSRSFDFDSMDMFLLFSHEWNSKGIASCKYLEYMVKQKTSDGPQNRMLEYGYVADSFHQEFSDTCALTPLWIARPIGATGKRNPLDTLDEIAERTLQFVHSSRSKQNF